MVLDSYDLEFLKLCGLARYMPCSLAEKYSLPMFGKQTTSSLLLNGYIKEVKGDCRCFRLKHKGKELLQGLGYDFPDDARPHKSGSIFKRRVISAELNLLLHTAGFNVYAKYMKHLEKDLTYLPSLTFRAVTKSKVLAGTRFYGMLRIGQTAYVIYHAESEADGIIPNYERDTFTSSLSRVENIKNIVIIIAGRTMEGLTRAMFPEKKQSLDGGFVAYSELTREWHYDFCLLPMDVGGVNQMRIMTMPTVRRDILERLGDTNLPSSLSRCDGMDDENVYIYGADMNISHVERAVNQAMHTKKAINIIALPNQVDMYEAFFAYMDWSMDIGCMAIKTDVVFRRYPNLIKYIPLQAVKTKEGKLIRI